MFKIAGPVILYGTAASVIYGVIYWIYSVLYIAKGSPFGEPYYIIVKPLAVPAVKTL